jgi:hypothetical protein
MYRAEHERRAERGRQALAIHAIICNHSLAVGDRTRSLRVGFLARGSPLLWVQSVIDALNTTPVAALCAVSAALFLLTLFALIRGMRLKKRVNVLAASVEALQTENTARYTRQILNRPIAGDDVFPADADGLRGVEGARPNWPTRQKAP